MKRFALFTAAAALSGTALAPVHAKESENETMMRQVAECGYVVSQAENEGVALKHGAATWDSIVSQVSQGTGLDAKPYLEQARATYKRYERKMGADYAFKRLVNRANDCNDQL